MCAYFCVVDQVHKKGGKIVLQLWHCGRAVVPEFIGGESPISASSIPVKGNHQMTGQPHPVPREASLEDIRELVEQHRVAAQNAKKAGFDGVQISAANGSLHDQFLKNGTNKRIDRYGGSVENRCRFLFECIAAVKKSFSANRISVRLTPTGRSQDMYDSNPYALLQYMLPELQKLDLQFLEVKRHAETDVKESSPGSGKDEEGRILPQKQIPGDYYESIRALYSGKIMANEGFNPQSAQELLNKGQVDLVSFGKLAISNPDLPERIRNEWPLNENIDWAHIFQGGATGYTDYPNYR
ncbi:hypothetical protein PPERSA_03066 [Pseudocohnilembus persalinus]|uniref:NADH:flavin oxidoreductase/NADH oxidase N-terminal domain-containing protein n=1 Tax=Pseudocohnilembus persalinus TaxID=266149 RepID=A0A0V0R9G4_PSEPJ|nr:hypothetical protein PPERSA_03066 [Pseudocohnilembus persalinus]|eukprot:KRX11008.1 hypothetical protein PPERSA_03066 [Pseudocohnilembus persalinus]